MHPADRSAGLLLAGAAVLCGVGVAQGEDRSAAGAATQDCGEFQASRYEILHAASAFPIDGTSGIGEDGKVLSEVRALRCLTSETDAVGKLRHLLDEGSLAGRLYALVGLRLLAPAYFNQAIHPYTCSEEKVLAAGGHIVTHVPVSGPAGAIGGGFYSESFLPHLKDTLPRHEWAVSIATPGAVRVAPPTGSPLEQPYAGASAEQLAAQRAILSAIPDPRVRYDARWIPSYVYLATKPHWVPMNLKDEYNRPELEGLLRMLRAILLAENTEELQLEEEGRSGPLRSLRFRQSIRGIPVSDAQLRLQVNDKTGHLLDLSARFLPDRGLPIAPRLTIADARRAALVIAGQYLQEKGYRPFDAGYRRVSLMPVQPPEAIGPLETQGDPRLTYRIGSMDDAYDVARLVWTVNVEASGPLSLDVTLDAIDGSMVALRSAIWN